MTSEEDFQNHLDQDPDDHQMRMVFADWLQDHDDPRANGYRALGKHERTTVDRLYPKQNNTFTRWGSSDNIKNCKYLGSSRCLPNDWHKLIYPEGYNTGTPETRRQMEDRAAHAFSQLPPERQHELLGLNEPQIDTPQQMSRLTNRRRSYKRYANS